MSIYDGKIEPLPIQKKTLTEQIVHIQNDLDVVFDEVVKLEKKLAIATKTLNGIRDVWANNPSQFSYIARIANRKAKTALEEMEGVK